MSNAQISHRLHISVRTTESHVSSLLRKYGVADRAALAALADQSEVSQDPGQVRGLPVTRTSFVGRSHEREVISNALRSNRLVTLLGPGGIGKTRLAIVAAEAMTPARGAAFVDLVPVRDGFVSQAVATALGVTEQPGQSLAASVVQKLRRGPCLIVMDNCEHLLDDAAATVDQLLSDCPDLTVLATSRERLAVPGEQIIPIGGLERIADAEQLFRDRASAVDPDFDADSAAIAEVCAVLDGLPLAFELAAARSAALGVEGLLTALDDGLLTISGGRGNAERHRSLHAVIGWSHDLLDDRERRLLRRLGAFAGRFDLNAVIAMVPEERPGEIVDLLGRLVEQSLVERVGKRWRLLETIRAYAAEQLVASGEQSQVQSWHFEWAVREAADLYQRLDGAWWEDLAAVVDDLHMALEANEAKGHQLARSLGHLAYARRFLTQALGYFLRAAGCAQDPADTARDLRSAADCVLVLRNSGSLAFAHLHDAAEHARRSGDRNGRAIALARAVEVVERFPQTQPMDLDHDELGSLLDTAADCGEAGRLDVAAQLAVARAWYSGSDPRAPQRSEADAALRAATASDDPVLMSSAMEAVSAAASWSGHLQEASTWASERTALIDRMSRYDPYAGPEITDALHMAATYAIAAGDLPAALSAARRVRDDELAGAHPFGAASKLISVLVLTGRFDEAIGHAQAMWQGWVTAGKPTAPASSPAAAAAALAYGLRGDGPNYAQWHERAQEMTGSADPGLRVSLAQFTAFVDARVAIHRQDTSHAETLIERAFDPRHGRYQSYARASAAELGVIANRADAAELMRRAAPGADRNHWAAGCLARAEGRLHGDVEALAASVAIWERIEARFERACTLTLIPERAAEGHAELEELSRH
jgi:predicted ATPase